MDQTAVDDDLALGRVPLGRLIARVAWIAIQLVIVFYFGQQGATFFYQNF